MIEQKEIAKIKDSLISSMKFAGENISINEIEIVNWGVPHEPVALPNGRMAVYAFFFNDKCLKVGKAGPKTRARYSSQHYNPGSSNSNLAKSIINDEGFPVRGITEDNVGDWIKDNTQRINILINQNCGMFILNFVEAFLQLYFQPRYEG